MTQNQKISNNLNIISNINKDLEENNSDSLILKNIIAQNFAESITVKQNAAQIVSESILNAANILISTIKQNNKILICGNGGSAADSQHFAAEFTGRYEIERKPLPVIALTTDTSAITAIGNDYNFDLIFAKQVEALGLNSDVLIAISTSGNSTNIIKAIDIAHQKNMRVIALTGNTGGIIDKQLNLTQDINICVPGTRTARIQETHILILHILCDAVDSILFK